jgi:hypothetical protein
MVKIRQVDVTAMDKPTAARGKRELTPLQREREEQQRQLARMLNRITGTDTVFEIRVEENEKPLTIRQRLMRVAKDEGKEIVVRKSERGWLVGMATPERRSRRGRRPGSRTGASKS